MSYRLPGWDKKRDQWLNSVGGEYADSGEVMEASVIYEAGAEAILKALKDRGLKGEVEGVRYYGYHTDVRVIPATEDHLMMMPEPDGKGWHGWLVFIPEEGK